MQEDIMDHVLSFTIDKKKYVSKPFDFEAFCLVNDKHIEKDAKSIYRICADAVKYMFDGTEATGDMIGALEPGEYARLCREVWDMYADALKNE